MFFDILKVLHGQTNANRTLANLNNTKMIYIENANTEIVINGPVNLSYCTFEFIALTCTIIDFITVDI